MGEGGCFCGAVRYRVEGPPLHAGWCHCRMCQRTVGAPVVPWGTWPADRFAWLRGEPRTFVSSAKGERSFCPSCGTSLPPEHHIWTMSRVPWLELADDLPRHEGSRST